MKTETPMTVEAKIVDALVRLNWHHGRGDVVAVDYANKTFTLKPFQMREEVRKFRYENGTLYAFGRQKKL
ncbi:hypothetical protein ABTA75_19090, partial [Acinetobacter baumannii]